MAGVINAVFFIAHPFTTAVWHKTSVASSECDFPVTIRYWAVSAAEH